MSHDVSTRRLIVTTAILAWTGVALPARAIFWNNDPAHGVTSSTGLTDRVDWFQNVHQINNTSNNTFGTTTLLNSEWAISVRHVVQNGGNYNQITAPANVYVNVLGVRYYADQIFTPDGGSEMSLIHLRGGVAGALNAASQVNGDSDEAGRYLHIGGYGYAGIFNAGTTVSLGSFHRAYNIGHIAGNGQIQIVADGEAELSSAGLLEGTVGSGDSGGPMWAYYGRGAPTPASAASDWRLVGLTATGSGGSGGEAWGGSSNYTRVANYANWVNSTLTSLPVPGTSTTGAWALHSGSNLYDTGSDKFSVTGSSALPAAHAHFGTGNGYTLDSVGDKLSLSAVLDTTLAMDNFQLGYGMFDDAGGAIAGNVSGGTAWNGYIVGNATEGASQTIHKKGVNGGGVGQWWSVSGANTGPTLGRAPGATGTYDDAAGIQTTPAGRYALSLQYTRVDTGLQIDFSTVQVDAANQPTGVYSHIGSALDTSPASWTYDQLGMFLYGASFTGTVIADDVNVAFTNMTTVLGDYDGNGVVDASDYTVWRDNYGSTASLAADGNHNGTIDDADYGVWFNAFVSGGGSGGASLAATVPESTTSRLASIAVLCAIGMRRRWSWRDHLSVSEV